MSVSLTLDIRLWQVDKPERIFSANNLITEHEKLKNDEDLLKAIMIDNFRCGLSIDGKVVSYATFMFTGQSSPDLIHLYEEGLQELYESKPTKIHFFESMICWRFTPEAGDMKWEVLDMSKGQANATVESEGRCERLPFIKSAIDWLEAATAILRLYQPDTKSPKSEDLNMQIDSISRLLAYSKTSLAELGWQ